MRPSPTLAVIVALAVSTAAATYTPGFRVVDGDTVDQAWWRWRVEGWDSPEIGGRAKCDAERALGERASARLRELLAGGGRVTGALKFDRDRRRIGRLYLADGREAGAVLAAEGLARPYTGGKRETWCPPAPPAAPTAAPI